LGLISIRPGLEEEHAKVMAEQRPTWTNMDEVFDMTESGRQYLDLMAKLPDNIEQTYPDPSEPLTARETGPF
jgi:hypothetical protein